MITFILAMDRNRGIGVDNKLPWHLPADLKFFRLTTTGHAVLMGRKTYESIGKPLPNRTNVVLTRDPEYKAEGVTVIHSPEEAVRQFEDGELFVIGGAEIFNHLMPYADKLLVTHIDHEFEADTYFAEIPESEWRVTSRTPGVTDEKNPYRFEFVTYERIR